MPNIPMPNRGSMESSLLEGDPHMAIDDCLQMSLLSEVTIPDETLTLISDTVDAGFDPDLVDRTRGWITKHRERNSRSAA
ncbi:MAG: hypothetical protein ACOX61_12820 [Brooklawnia sp.]|jgi:hypothetical protein